MLPHREGASRRSPSSVRHHQQPQTNSHFLLKEGSTPPSLPVTPPSSSSLNSPQQHAASANNNKFIGRKQRFRRRSGSSASLFGVPIRGPLVAMFTLWLLIILFGYSRFYRYQTSMVTIRRQNSDRRHPNLVLSERRQDLLNILLHHQQQQEEETSSHKESTTIKKQQDQDHHNPSQTENVKAPLARFEKDKANDNPPPGRVAQHSSVEEQVDVPEEEEEEEEEYDDEGPPLDMIHIIHTRFMQQQPQLVHLGLARLLLFKTIFLASLEQQSSKNFVVTIRTDPDLHPILKTTLLQVLNNSTLSSKQLLVLPTNANPSSRHYEDIVQYLTDNINDNNNATNTYNTHSIWSGNATRILNYLTISSNLAILETRLDADDGLSRHFVETMQNEASMGYFATAPTNTWRIWCAGKHVEWQYDAPWQSGGKHDNKNGDNEDSATGSLVSLQLTGCITAGLTQAYILPSAYIPFPTSHHQSLYGSVTHCREEDDEGHAADIVNSNCLSILDLAPTALRARTPTSAGMLNVVWNGKGNNNNHNDTKPSNKTKRHAGVPINKNYVRGASKQEAYQETLWEISEQLFGFSPSTASRVHYYLEQHMLEIATDNLQGQCTTGHSCKNSSQALLQAIIAASNTTTTKTTD